MPSNLHNNFDLPPAGGFSEDQQDSREAGTRVAFVSQSSAVGVGIVTENLTTKVEEGAQTILSTFGDFSAFEKMGAYGQPFSTIASNISTQLPKNNVLESLYSSTTLTDAQKSQLRNTQTGSVSAAGVNSIVGKEKPESRDHLFSLRDSRNDMVEFIVMPEVVENRNVEYEAVAPAQFPGAFQKYKGTSSVQWTVNATFISRTTNEATLNLMYLNRLRGWTMPYFGENSATSYPGMLGAPPDVLTFKGLRDSMVGPVPVVITSLNWNWPRDVDYIPAYAISGDGEGGATIPFPSVMQVAIQLVESLSTTQFNQFSLADYRKGDMTNAYGRATKMFKDVQNASASVSSSQESQTIQTNVRSAGAGRGFVNPPTAAQISERKTATVTTVTSTVQKATDKFTAGGGGDFGGGGASGSW